MIASEGHGFRVKVDRVVWDRERVGPKQRRCLLAFSAVGGSTQVRAVRAALNVNRSVSFSLVRTDRWGRQNSVTLDNDEEGYQTMARGLGLRHYHLVGVARRPGFLPAATPDALWGFLRKHTTTPLDRRWLDALAERMIADGAIVRPNCEGGGAQAIVKADDDYMDRIVLDLLARRVIEVSTNRG